MNNRDKAGVGVPRLWLKSAGWGLLLAWMSVSAPAQTTTGTIVGTATDATGSVIPDLTITVTEKGTNSRRVVLTNQQDQYTVSLLPIGHYTVQGEKSGFSTQTVRDIVLEVNQTARIDLTMQVGAVTQKVEVIAAAALLKTDTSDVGTVIGEKPVVELPLNGRNFLQLATLAPGTLPLNHVDGVMQYYYGGIVANGADSNGNDVTLDGIENQDWLIPAVGVRLSPDATAEFKV